MRIVKLTLLLAGMMLIFFEQSQAAVYVSNIQATCRNGQTFITWTCPTGSNYKYKVYRATYKLGSKSKINSSTYLGYVMDSSSLNVRKTRKTGANVFYVIENGANPLAASTGLYVATCDANASYFYAVTVTDLATNTEYTKITLGSNSLSAKLKETVADPQPVLQGTETLSATGDLAYDYVWFGNNQDLPNFPVMFNQGSYGFNFFIVYRGNPTGGPLYMFHEGLEGNALVGNGLGSFDTITNCTILSNDDWLPVPNGYGPTAGINTFWSGYHEDYNPYLLANPIHTTGKIRMYQQHRYIHTIDWANKYLSVDSNRVYLVGVSAGGFGALLTAMMVPQKIAAVYTIVAPVVIKSTTLDNGDTTDEQLWGNASDNLPSDVNDPTTGLPLAIFDLMNIKTMLQKNQNVGLPPIYSIHGKNDNTVYWSDKPNYLNQNENYDQGGIHFWDQRQHDGTGANFVDGETTPRFLNFKKNLSYPAFANCTVNENPGDGTPTNGDNYGSYSGYIGWDTITDTKCKWTCHMFMPAFTVGGVVQHSEYTYCYADITARRPQVFKPNVNDVLKWYLYDKDNVQISSGSFTYKGGPITVAGVKVKKSGSRLEVSIKNCTAKEEDDITTQTVTDQFTVNNTYNGWKLNILSSHEQSTHLQVMDMLGRMVTDEVINLQEGQNTVNLQAPQYGSYIIRLQGASIRQSERVIY